MANVNETHVEIELNATERSYYDRVRERLRPMGRSLDSDVRDLLLLLPDLTMLMFRLLRDDRVAVGDKAVMLLGLGYVLSPIDILPAFFFGPLGLLDDLVVVAATLSRLINHVHPDVVRSHWSGQGDALRAIQRVTDWSEREIGGRVRRVLRGLRG